MIYGIGLFLALILIALAVCGRRRMVRMERIATDRSDIKRACADSAAVSVVQDNRRQGRNPFRPVLGSGYCDCLGITANRL